MKAMVRLLALGFSIVLAMACERPAAKPATGSAQIVMPQTTPPVVTLAEFQRVKDSMTYEEVRSIIGTPGEEMSSSSLGSTKTVMYQWTNSNGSNMNAMFQDDKLITKAQYGLP